MDKIIEFTGISIVALLLGLFIHINSMFVFLSMIIIGKLINIENKL